MREIKFRAYIGEDNEQLHYYGQKLIKGMQYEVYIDNKGRYIDRKGWGRKEIPIMQFTGLNDKNGKEIYEGDIVRIQHPRDKNGDFGDTLGEVFWWDEEAGFYHGNSEGRPPKKMWYYSEVVGNIYENPELIK